MTSIQTRFNALKNDIFTLQNTLQKNSPKSNPIMHQRRRDNQGKQDNQDNQDSRMDHSLPLSQHTPQHEFAHITILPVTKHASPDQIKELLMTCDVEAIGENRVQNIVDRYEWVNRIRPVKWHLIGPLQKNKVKKAVRYCDVIQSVDSIALLRKIEQEAAKIQKPIQVYIQFNVSQEPQKFGFDPQEATVVLQEKAHLNWVTVSGVMAMAELSEDLGKIRENFRKTHALYEVLKAQYNDCKTLCIGMTDDYQIAIEEGATMIRIGRYLFET